MVLAIPCGKALDSFFELKAVDKGDQMLEVFVINDFLLLVRNSTICDNSVIQITNWRKGIHCQQKVINAFSCLKKEIEMITFSNGKTFHIDKIEFVAV